MTNMDIHDIARSARTYGVRRYYLVTPIEDQHALVGRILGHWSTDRSREYHPDRFEALSRVRLAWNFAQVKAEIEVEHGLRPRVVLTSARAGTQTVSAADLRKEIAEFGGSQPWILVFGTGWGISESFSPEVDRVLAPVYGPEGAEGYNHLSVRAAAAAILDRLFGR